MSVTLIRTSKPTIGGHLFENTTIGRLYILRGKKRFTYIFDDKQTKIQITTAQKKSGEFFVFLDEQ